MNNNDILDYLDGLTGEFFDLYNNHNFTYLYKWYRHDESEIAEKILKRNGIPYKILLKTSVESRIDIEISDIISKIREDKINSILKK